jgi:hypothetical protein
MKVSLWGLIFGKFFLELDKVKDFFTEGELHSSQVRMQWQ